MVLSIIPIFLKAQSDTDTIKIMTFNIRYATHDDAEFSWEFRKGYVLGVIEKYVPDIVGFQEVLESQVLFLNLNLPDYNWVGVGRDDGNKKGEFVPIFYKRNRFKLLYSGNFWLSETPEKPSRGWDAAYNRMVTFVKLHDSIQNKDVFVFNTHFDHKGKEAQLKGAILLNQKIAEIAGESSVIITGDFNVKSNSKVFKKLVSNDLQNTENLCIQKHIGPNYTFVGFPFNPDPKNTIDFIFINDKKTFKVLKHQTITDNVRGYYPSDHLPVIVEFIY